MRNIAQYAWWIIPSGAPKSANSTQYPPNAITGDWQSECNPGTTLNRPQPGCTIRADGE